MFIRNISNCIKGDYLAVITGDNLDKAEAVMLENVKDNKVTEVECLNKTKSTVTFRVPKGNYSPYKAWVKAGNEESNTVIFNAPEIKWVMEDNLYAGGELKIIGQGFVNIDCYKEREGNSINGYTGYIENHSTKVYLLGEKTYEADIKKISNYEICAAIPEDIAIGSYKVIVEYAAKSNEYQIDIQKKNEYPQEIFNVLDYGAKAIDVRDVRYTDFYDSSEAFQKALDAAHKNGGGTVFIPNGRYCLENTLWIYPHTRLVGENRNRVWLEAPLGTEFEFEGCGWGTFAEGEKMYSVIASESGDFTVENLSMICVYSPMMIAAPVIKTTPVFGNDMYNCVPAYSNLLDFDKQADNIVVKNCNILHEPRYLEHRKNNDDPLLVGGFQQDYKRGELNEKYFYRLEVWSAIAVKGDKLRVEGCKIQGAGSCIRAMGTNNSTFTGNTLHCGDFGNCFAFFSSSYNPDIVWKRPVKNIVMEDNIMKPLTNVTRGVMWLMEDHCNYFMKGNKIDTYYYMADNEGFCFHLWGNHLKMKALSGDKNIKIDMTSLNNESNVYDAHKNAETDCFKDNTFAGKLLYVTSGMGIGQCRKIVSNDAENIVLETPLDCKLDETSVVCVSDVEKFSNLVIIDNEVAEMGRGIYTWGSCLNSVVDGNTLYGNGGVILEDLSFQYDNCGYWQHAGHMFNQLINNRVYMPRGFGQNYGIVGISGGSEANSTTSIIIRGNVCEDDTILAAKPRHAAKDGLNYTGIVIENNKSLDCKIGIEVDENISATLSKNEFENVEQEIIGAGEFTVLL